jgi:transposase-like protein
MTREERQNRRFSDKFKQQKVKEIESGKTTVTQISRAYEVRRGTVYKWVRKYSPLYQRKERMIIERRSDTAKILTLQEEVRVLEQAVGQKQIQIDVLEKLIEIAEETYGLAIKKNTSSRRSSGFGIGKKRVPTA